MWSVELITRLEKVCDSIVELDPLIRSAWIINGRGNSVAGGMRVGLRSLEDTKKDEMLFTELALRVRMRHEFDQELGKVHFSLSHREKVLVMSFPLPDNWAMLVSAEPGIDFSSIPFKVIEILGDLGESEN